MHVMSCEIAMKVFITVIFRVLISHQILLVAFTNYVEILLGFGAGMSVIFLLSDVPEGEL